LSASAGLLQLAPTGPSLFGGTVLRHSGHCPGQRRAAARGSSDSLPGSASAGPFPGPGPDPQAHRGSLEPEGAAQVLLQIAAVAGAELAAGEQDHLGWVDPGLGGVAD